MAINAKLKKEIEELPSELQEKLLKLIHFLKKEFFVMTKKEKKRLSLQITTLNKPVLKFY